MAPEAREHAVRQGKSIAFFGAAFSFSFLALRHLVTAPLADDIVGL